jgi:hypothetical protein
VRLTGTLVGSITPEILTNLVLNKVGESRVLEFKSVLPGQRTEDKKEFLADVAAFANAAGGVIVYGVETERDSTGQDTGIAKRISGLPEVNADKETQRLAAMLHDGVEPSLASYIVIQTVQSHDLPHAVLVLGIGQSLARPHMISFDRSGKFWRRGDAGKYQPDIGELRSMFLDAASWIHQAEAFRDVRLKRVRSEGVIPLLTTGSALFVHVLPLGRLDGLMSFANNWQQLQTLLGPPDGSGYSHRFNADGFLTFRHDHKNHVTAYTQWLRFGGVEGFLSEIVMNRDLGGNQPATLFFAQHTCDVALRFANDAIRAMQSALQIDPPFVVMLALFGLRDSYVHTQDMWLSDRTKIGVDSLLLPAITVNDVTQVAEAVQPLVDIVWQTGGLPSAPTKKRR